MSSIDALRNKVIDWILATNNKKLLQAIDGIFELTGHEEQNVLSSTQIDMLMMSEADIGRGEVLSQDDLDKLDQEWLSFLFSGRWQTSNRGIWLLIIGTVETIQRHIPAKLNMAIKERIDALKHNPEIGKQQP